MSQDGDGVVEAMRWGAQLAVTLGAQSLEAAARMPGTLTVAGRGR